MTESEAIERLYNMKNKVDVALMNSKHEKGHWLYDDVQGTADTLRMAIKALEKQKKIKEAFTHYAFNGYDMNVLNDCVQCLAEIKDILNGGDEE